MSQMRHICLMAGSNRLSTAEAIIEAGFAVFSRDPSASLSVVAEAAGVGRATLHRYFPGRDHLINELARIAITEMDEAAQAACAEAQTAADVLEMTLHALVPLADRHGFLGHLTPDEDDELQAEFRRQQAETEEMFAGAKEEGVFDRSVPTSWLVQAYEFLLYAAWESVRTGEATAEQAARLAWRTLKNGLEDQG